MRTSRIAAIVLTCVAALTSCDAISSGGSAPTPLLSGRYAKSLSHIVDENTRANRAITSNLEGGSLKLELRAALKRFEINQRDLASQVSNLQPPTNAATANADLATALTDAANAVQSLLSRLDQATTQKQILTILQTNAAAEHARHELLNAIEDLIQLGYVSAS